MENIIKEAGMEHQIFRDASNFEKFSFNDISVKISNRVVEEIENEMAIPMDEWIVEVNPSTEEELVKEINTFIDIKVVI